MSLGGFGFFSLFNLANQLNHFESLPLATWGFLFSEAWFVKTTGQVPRSAMTSWAQGILPVGRLGGPAHRPLLRREKSKAGTSMHAPGLTSGGETRKTRMWYPVGSLGQSKVWTQTTPETGESNFSISHKHFFDGLLDAGLGEGGKKWLYDS